MGSMRKAMIRSGISSDKSPNEQKPRKPPASGEQKNVFAGTAKKKYKKDKVAQRSLVPIKTKNQVFDSDDDYQPEFGGTVIKPQKYMCPQSINAQPLMTGMKRHDLDCILRINEREASVDRKESLNEVDARFSIDAVTGVVQMSYLVHQRSKRAWNLEVQRIHEVMHSISRPWTTS